MTSQATRRRTWRKAVMAFAMAAAASGVIVVAPTPAAPSYGVKEIVDDSAYGTTARQYVDVYLPTQIEGMEWTGSVDTCQAGTTSKASTERTIDAINYYRGLAGLDPVTLDAGNASSSAQQAALMFLANDKLSHDPDASWLCYTAEGAAAAGAANISIGWGWDGYGAGANAVANYMVDQGEENTKAGHRRWLLEPTVAAVGVGSTSNTNAVRILDTARNDNATNPGWIPWPTAGYFPAELEPDGRWSLSYSGADFSAASVSVTRDGLPVPVTIESSADQGYGINTLVFSVEGVSRPVADAEATYRVTVTGIGGAADTRYSYDVVLFNPTIRPVQPFAIEGVAQAGRELTVGQLIWSQVPETVSYQWLRDGEEIAKATGPTYTPSNADAGALLSVRVSGARGGWVSGSEVSAPTKPIAGVISVGSLRLRGQVQPGAELSARPVGWGPADLAFSYRWFLDGVEQPGSAASLNIPDLGANSVRVEVTATATGYLPETRTASFGASQAAPATKATAPTTRQRQAALRPGLLERHQDPAAP